jgi:hypothetical protein
MRMNRRNVLAGIGALTAGGGAIFGSGAFSSVEAQRNAKFTVTNDGSAELGLSGDGTYVTSTDTGNGGQTIIEFQFDSLNDNATSVFEGVLDVTNSSSDGTEKSVYIQDAGTVTPGGVVDFEDSSGNSVVGSTNAIAVSNGSTVTFDIVIDSTAGDPSTVGDVTIVAE